jgi:hypothetical protein
MTLSAMFDRFFQVPRIELTAQAGVPIDGVARTSGRSRAFDDAKAELPRFSSDQNLSEHSVGNQPRSHRGETRDQSPMPPNAFVV